MSIFPIPFIEDLIPSGSEDQSHDASGDESSDYSDSVMLSGISTDSTTDLTMVDPPSTMEAPDSPTPSLGDHGAAIMPPGLFIEIYREQLARNDEDDASDATSAMSEFGGTIVSSAPSGAQIDAPPLETSWAMTSTPPRPIHRENASISTTESMYRELASLEEDLVHVHEVQDDQSVDSSHLSLRPSMMDSSVVRSTWSLPSATERPNATSHERTTFVNVGDRLALQPIREDESEWFERFTDQDWLNFRRDADMILGAIDPGATTTTRLPMPPAPPEVEGASVTNIEPYVASSCLPSSFICPLCDDIIVGATTLDCACPQSTVCMTCWEEAQTKVVDNEDDDELENLVFVDHNRSCPFCDKPSSRGIPCHALDVAILQCVKGLPAVHVSVQTAYYRRLAAWRKEVQRRRGCDTSDDKERDQLLGELIRREEEYFGKQKTKQQSFWQSNKGLQIAAEIVLVTAGVALCGSQVARAVSQAFRR